MVALSFHSELLKMPDKAQTKQVDSSSATTSLQSINGPKRFNFSDFELVKLLGRGSYGKV